MTTLTITFNGKEYRFTEDKPVILTFNGDVIEVPVGEDISLEIGTNWLESEGEGE